MRFLLVGMAFMSTMLALIPMSRTARADGAQTQVFAILCLPEANLFEIRAIGDFEEPKGLAAGSTFDLTEKGHALYSPAWAFYRPDIPVDKHDKITDLDFALHVTRFECRLRTNTIKLTVVPIFSGRNYGGRVSDIAVSLGIAERWVVENLPFEPCEDRGPITRLAYEGDLDSITFDGRFGGVWPDKVSSREAWDNRHRRFYYHESILALWDPLIQGREKVAIPLRSKDLDYFQDSSNSSYGVPISECY